MIEIQFSREEIASYKRRFNHQLEPIKVMLVKKKKEMMKQEWLEYTDRTRKSILKNPDQYLMWDTKLPDAALLENVINRIFDDFIMHMKFD
ncbi:MAG TPA: hypothetical protein VGK59_13705 [Ohtaekwangia sp.]